MDESPSTVDRYAIQKKLLGRIAVFNCPKCQSPLETKLADAGQLDRCPSCGNGFVSPGKAELNSLKEAEAHARDEKLAKQRQSQQVAVPQRPQAPAAAPVMPVVPVVQSVTPAGNTTIVHVHAPPKNGIGTAGFVLSIIGIFTCGVVGILGLVFSLVGLGRQPRGLAIAGTIISLAQVAVAIIVFVIFGAAISAVISGPSSPTPTTSTSLVAPR